MKHCAYCGAQLPDDARACSFCGRPVMQTSDSRADGQTGESGEPAAKDMVYTEQAESVENGTAASAGKEEQQSQGGQQPYENQHANENGRFYGNQQGYENQTYGQYSQNGGYSGQNNGGNGFNGNGFSGNGYGQGYDPLSYGSGNTWQNNQPSGEPMRNGLATASFVLSLVGIVLDLFTFGIPSILALIFGLIARRQMKDRPGKYAQGWMATVGIVLGAVLFVLTVVLYVFSFALVMQLIQEPAFWNSYGHLFDYY